MRAGQRLAKILRIFEQEKVIENIEKSRNKMKAFTGIKNCFQKDIESLKEEIVEPIQWVDKISVKQAVCMVTVCLMAEIDDNDLLDNCEILQEALLGSQKYTNLQYFLTTGRVFSNEDTEYLVNLFFK